jgi:hypothetical protein
VTDTTISFESWSDALKANSTPKRTHRFPSNTLVSLAPLILAAHYILARYLQLHLSRNPSRLHSMHYALLASVLSAPGESVYTRHPPQLLAHLSQLFAQPHTLKPPPCCRNLFAINARNNFIRIKCLEFMIFLFSKQPCSS